MPRNWSPPSTERAARVELAAAYRYAHSLGWTDMGATHFSARVPGEQDSFLLLREGLFFNEVTASNLVKVVLSDSPGGSREANPAGITIHAALLNGRSSLGSVMHTHSVAGVAVANDPNGLMPLSQHAMRFYGAQGFHDYEGVALDDDEGPRLVEHLGDHELLLMRNHGLLTAAADVPTAFSALYYAETACRMQVATLSATSQPVTPDHQVCAHTKKQYDASSGYVYRDWTAILRELERTQPDFAC